MNDNCICRVGGSESVFSDSFSWNLKINWFLTFNQSVMLGHLDFTKFLI